MKIVVVFLSGLVSGVFCHTWGHPQPVADTPEVAAAKAAHLAALASASASNAWSPEPRSWAGPEDDGSWTETKYDGHDGWQGDRYDGSWGGDAQSWNEGSAGDHWQSHEKKWTGPVALPPGYDKNGAPLQVLDTPEVAAAKAAHLAAVASRRY